MGGEQPSEALAAGDAAERRPPFEAMMRRHREGAAFHRRFAFILGGAGLVVFLLGILVSPTLRLPAMTLGLLAMALSLLPLRQSRERQERVDGLMVLADEWATGTTAERGRLTDLLARLYR
jgi:hypothetical protein